MSDLVQTKHAVASAKPAAIYIASLAPSGRPAMISALRTVARILQPGADPSTVHWVELRYEHVQAIKAKLSDQYAPRTVNRILSAIRGVLTAAWNLELISTENYQRAVKVRSVPRQMYGQAGRALPQEEVEALVNAVETSSFQARVRDAAIIAVMYAGGLRRDEIVKLNLQDYNAETKSLQVIRGKRGKPRTVFITETWLRKLQTWITMRGNTPGPMFFRYNRDGKTIRRLGALGVTRVIKCASTIVGGAKFTPHDLRRSYGTNLLQRGADLSTVKNMMGHEDIATTSLYDRRGDAEKRAAANLLKTATTLEVEEK